MRHKALEGMTEIEIDALYDELREVAGDLHIPQLEAVITVSLIKPNGEKIEQFSRHSRSFTRNLFNHHAWRHSVYSEDSAWADGDLTLRNTSGTILGNTGVCPYVHVANMKTGGYCFRTYGHIAGTDDTAEDFGDYQLGSEIAHGTGAGQLSRGLCSFHSEGWSAGGPYYWATWDRYLTNSSGGEITAYEFGTQWRSRTPANTIMWSRDVEAGGVAIPNGDILYIAYEHRISYP